MLSQHWEMPENVETFFQKLLSSSQTIFGEHKNNCFSRWLISAYFPVLSQRISSILGIWKLNHNGLIMVIWSNAMQKYMPILLKNISVSLCHNKNFFYYFYMQLSHCYYDNLTILALGLEYPRKKTGQYHGCWYHDHFSGHLVSSINGFDYVG